MIFSRRTVPLPLKKPKTRMTCTPWRACSARLKMTCSNPVHHVLLQTTHLVVLAELRRGQAIHRRSAVHVCASSHKRCHAVA